jgi:MEDS: MEthanogen/methylotroph, DcmR Sensory domain
MQFLHDSRAADHGVHVYQESEALARSVGDYVRAGLDAGEPVLVIARAEHVARFLRRITDEGCDVERALADERVSILDVDETLIELTEGGVLSASRFAQVIGGALDAVARRFPGQRIRAYGEIVDVLAGRRELKTAFALEQLWHELLERRGDFSLLCGYRLDVFDAETQVRALPHVWAAHSYVLAVDDEKRFAAAVDHALEEVLGYTDAGKVYLCVADRAREGRVPISELALMWVSEHMPTRAERITASARARYFGAPLVPITA